MREPYIPLFCSITDSTIWSADAETCKVFITLLAKADPEGYVAAAPDGIAATARLPIEAVERSLAILMAPDLRSRNKENEGRRVVEVPRGYHVPAIPWFRKLARDEAERARKRQWARDNNSGRPVSASAKARRTETETDSQKRNSPPESKEGADAPLPPKALKLSSPEPKAKSKREKFSAIPESWQPNAKHAEKVRHWPPGRLAFELEKFRNWDFKTPRIPDRAWFTWIADVSSKLPIAQKAPDEPSKWRR